MNSEPLFKVIVIGDATVGKTSLIQRYVNNTYRPNYKATIGVDFGAKLINLDNGERIKIQLWDIAGQERFRSMTHVYYKNTNACIVMFDVTKSKSLQNAIHWKSDLDDKCTLDDGSPVPCLLLGNKCDLPERDKDYVDQIEDVCKNNSFVSWTEISVQENLMVEESFSYLIKIMIEHHVASKLSSDYCTALVDSVNLKQRSPYDELKDNNCSC